MPVFFHIGFAIFIIVLQTGAAVYFPFDAKPCDLMIPFAVYLTLYRRSDEGLPVLITAGAFMDALSNGPVGVYFITYIWIFLVFKRMTRWVHIHYAALFFFISCLGLLFENAVFWVAALFISHARPLPENGPAILSVQLVWLICTLPFLFILLKRYFRAVDNITSGSRFKSLKD